MSAHPRVDRDREELHNLSYDVMKGTCTYYRYDQHRQLLNKVGVHITNARMVHDMQFTKDWIIVADLPLEFNPEKAMMTNSGPFAMNTKGATRYGFLRRDAHNADGMIWITAPVHCAFHFVNAYQESDSKVILHGCLYDWLDFNFSSAESDETKNVGAWLKRIEFDLTKKTLEITKIKDSACEFPTINPLYQGKKARYTYLVDNVAPGECPKECEDDVFTLGFVKYDL
jgi:carotenoid cleavage dioxygenase-like enzyme